MAAVLGIGIATIDIINDVDHYPHEDEELRALSQQRCRGGNAANTLAVLGQLGHRGQWCGVLTNDGDGQFVRDELAACGIGCDHARQLAHGRMPTSYITRNRANGSRTIVHYRELPELDYACFAAIDLAAFDWLHAEGRNIDDTRRMLQRAAARRPQLPRSVEIEKPRPGIAALFPLADLLLFSRHYAQATGERDGAAFLARMHEQLPGIDLVCGWGEHGAYAIDRDGRGHFQPACPPPQVVDTLGAGDTFNAAIIDGRLRGLALPQALAHGCRLAGQKCGVPGLRLPSTVEARA
ncbi:MAG: ketohexokinase [Gammaproteobacteria bacterium]|nr:ketohexokinase [Gammaproteobacteria bacterium]